MSEELIEVLDMLYDEQAEKLRLMSENERRALNLTLSTDAEEIAESVNIHMDLIIELKLLEQIISNVKQIGGGSYYGRV